MGRGTWRGADGRVRGGRYRRGAVVTLAFVCVASFTGVGHAASGTATSSGAKHTSAQAQYGNGGPVKPAMGVKGAVATGTSSASNAPPTVAEGALPFTGMSLFGIAGLGAALVGVGVAVFRRGGSRS